MPEVFLYIPTFSHLSVFQGRSVERMIADRGRSEYFCIVSAGKSFKQASRS